MSVVFHGAISENGIVIGHWRAERVGQPEPEQYTLYRYLCDVNTPAAVQHKFEIDHDQREGVVSLVAAVMAETERRQGAQWAAS